MAQEQTILPKGIVLNRNAVYEEIAKYDVFPVEQILRACHVFSTTSRELYDPTARRLENFWTRVLGGNRRYLPGRVIAQLFKDISEETSFVKLRGPLNRYEPPSPGSSASKTHSVQASSEKLASKPKGRATTSSTKPPHPILKKPRGPSASGPRPTARFVSPPESETDENIAKGSEANSPSTAATHSADSKDSSSSTAREEMKKGNTNRSKKKKTTFVASTASRRRPNMPRRSSSQSSTGASDIGSKEGGSSLGSKYDGSQSSVPPIPEKPEQQSAITHKGKGSANVSAKAAGKRPVTPSHTERSTPSEPGVLQNRQSQGESSVARDDGAENERRSSANYPENKGKVAEDTKNRQRTVQNKALHKNDAQERSHLGSVPAINQSSSDISSMRPARREASRVPIPPSSLMSSTPAKLDTSVIGQGTISGFTESITSQASMRGELGGQSSGIEALERSRQSSGVTGPITPTQPSNTSTIPLDRSKSQLSLLLDRRGERKSRR
ncbi:hypothetical protein F5Y19DRAFT_480135 [Xylariaceae sp. FL1651]|nr:hypothetical protein F5Y19DRAFT_480135 [Xylariaceae sp. FL1651]